MGCLLPALAVMFYILGERHVIKPLEQILAFCCAQCPSVSHFQLILRLELMSVLRTLRAKIKQNSESW